MAKKTKSEELMKSSKHCDIFKLYKGENNKIQIVVGNNIVCGKKFDTYEQADDYIGTKPYDLIFIVATLNAHYLYLKLKNDEETKKTEEAAK